MPEKPRFLQMIPDPPLISSGMLAGTPRYCGLIRDGLEIHLPWHADDEDDPLLGGSVIKLFVNTIKT
ncbi:hypothetical protein [Aureicoccus marinus]|uniref:hypothetical protein n=1 Tax=Aureicoccus marinus TaxID=754435 RepID=UPI001C614EA5|nr:hypothetical protein [Aureicoccus marinus]